MERDTFIFRKKWYEAIKCLDDKTKAAAFDRICQYALYHNTAEATEPMVRMAMAFIVPELEADCEKWLDVKAKRRAAGQKGAATTNEIRWGSRQESSNDDTCREESAKVGKSQQISSKSADNVIPIVNVNENVSFLGACAHEAERKERKGIFIEIEKEMLRKGATDALAEADAFWQYNTEHGWVDGKGRQIYDKLAWARKWKVQCPISQSIARYADVFFEMCLAAHQEENADVIAGFAGLTIKGDRVNLMFCDQRRLELFIAAERNEDFVSRMQTLFAIHFPNKYLQYSVKP